MYTQTASHDDHHTQLVGRDGLFLQTIKTLGQCI